MSNWRIRTNEEIMAAGFSYNQGQRELLDELRATVLSPELFRALETGHDAYLYEGGIKIEPWMLTSDPTPATEVLYRLKSDEEIDKLHHDKKCLFQSEIRQVDITQGEFRNAVDIGGIWLNRGSYHKTRCWLDPTFITNEVRVGTIVPEKRYRLKTDDELKEQGIKSPLYDWLRMRLQNDYSLVEKLVEEGRLVFRHNKGVYSVENRVVTAIPLPAKKKYITPQLSRLPNIPTIERAHFRLKTEEEAEIDDTMYESGMEYYQLDQDEATRVFVGQESFGYTHTETAYTKDDLTTNPLPEKYVEPAALVWGDIVTGAKGEAMPLIKGRFIAKVPSGGYFIAPGFEKLSDVKFETSNEILIEWFRYVHRVPGKLTLTKRTALDYLSEKTGVPSDQIEIEQ